MNTLHGRRDVEPVERAARPRGALLQERAQLRDVLGREQRRDPAVGDLAGERGVLRPDRGEVDRDLLLHGGDGQLERLAETVGEWQLEGLAVELARVRARAPCGSTATYSRVRCSCLRKPLPVPALGDLRPGGADPEDHAPAGELVDRRGGHRGHRRPSARASGRSRSRAGSSRSARPASRARSRRPSRRPRPPTPSHSPSRSASCTIVQLVLGAEPETPVADVHA